MLANKNAASHFGEHFERMPAIQSMELEIANERLMSVDILRLDKVHPFISGNKWFKLKHHLLEGYEAGKTEFISFGGAYSNHLHALAYTGQELGFKTIGFVRGQRPKALSPTLLDCQKWGMELHWLDREEYRNIASQATQEDYVTEYPNAWVIPEGGAGRQGVLGIEALFNSLFHAGKIDYDLIACPVGSGATLAGIIRSNLGRAHCLGFSALRGASDLEQRVERQLLGANKVNPWRICHLYHFGGFAHINNRLTNFISAIYEEHQILLDPVYTGKMMYGLAEYVHQGRIQAGARILMVHTGGLQGWRGFGDQYQHLFEVET